MTYSLGGLVQASDYNGFVSTNSPNVNAIWGTGSGNSGYGQTPLTTKSSDNLILASDWLTLFNTIQTAANHQGTSLNSLRDSTPANGDMIFYESNLAGNINLINTNRNNAILQGSTSSSSAVSSSTWADNLTITFTVTFASDNAARYYFNAGGQIGFTFSHPAGGSFTINQLISDLCSDVGTLWFSNPSGANTVTLAGTSYTGVTKQGGQSNGSTTINTGNGFGSVYPSGSNILLTQYSEFVYHSYSSTFLRVSVSYNGSGGFTFTTLIDEIPNGATVSTGTTGNITIRPPSTTYLTNTWGTPSVSSSVSPV